MTGKPACGPVRCHAPGACRPVPRWRRSPSGAALIVGVDQNTNLFGFRDPSTGQLEGFDIDVAREIARGIFGDPNRIDLRVVEAGHREDALKSGEVDVVVRTYSITCDRKKVVAFSTTYFNATRRSWPSRDRESIPPQHFRVNACAR